MREPRRMKKEERRHFVGKVDSSSRLVCAREVRLVVPIRALPAQAAEVE